MTALPLWASQGDCAVCSGREELSCLEQAYVSCGFSVICKSKGNEMSGPGLYLGRCCHSLTALSRATELWYNS